MKYTKIKQIAKGWSSYNWIVKDKKGKEFLLKEVREKSPRKDLANREGRMLLLANSVGVGPKVKEINFEENFVVREYIKGENFFNFILSERFDNEITPLQTYNLIKEIYRQLLLLDKINLSHNQLQIGKNILVKRVFDAKLKEVKYLPVIIDFEKATIKENHTKNLGQLLAMCFFNPNATIAKKIREKLNLIL